MKITRRQLRRIIKEEREKLVSEAFISPRKRNEIQEEQATALVKELASQIDDLIGSLEAKDPGVLKQALYKVQSPAGDYRSFADITDETLMSIILQQVVRR